MKTNTNTKKILGYIALSIFTVTGTYNAVVINSESSIDGYNITLVKRLDEVYGIIKPGRLAASVGDWKKINPQDLPKTENKPTPKIVTNIEPTTKTAPAAEIVPDATATAAIQEDLNLNLVEVINPKKWQQPLNSSQFRGALTANNGILESLDISLPGGEGVSVSFSEMTGNVFQYDMAGEIYSGMLYQVDQTSYRIVMTGGPLDGTSLRFVGELGREEAIAAEQSEQYLAETEGVQVGNFGEDLNQNPQIQAEQAFQQDQVTTEQAMQQEAQGFNFEEQQTPIVQQ